MKKRMILCITLAAILLVGSAAYWTFCSQTRLTGSVIKNPDSYRLDIQHMNGTDRHTMKLNAGDALAVSFETETGKLRMEIHAPDGNILYSGNGKAAADFTVNITEDGSYTVTVKARSAKGRIHIQTERQKK